jgi:hypothetical protein
MLPLHQNQTTAARMLPLPAELPLPKYQLGQVVQWPTYRGALRWGIIRGLQYFTPGMSAALYSSLEWVGWSYLVEVNPDSCHVTDIEDVHEQDLELREETPCTL